MNISSENIKIFPSARRNDSVDRNARLNSEQNLVSLVNRLTGSKSFVIDGFDTITSNSINGGSCNIHGYYITISSNISLSDFQYSSGPVIYLAITVSQRDGFSVIVGGDENDVYKGVEVTQGVEGLDDQVTSGGHTYYLPIAKIASNGTKSVISDGSNRVKYVASDVKLGTQPTYTSNETFVTLQDYITNLVIDDGEIL